VKKVEGEKSAEEKEAIAAQAAQLPRTRYKTGKIDGRGWAARCGRSRLITSEVMFF